MSISALQIVEAIWKVCNGQEGVAGLVFQWVTNRVVSEDALWHRLGEPPLLGDYAGVEHY